MNEKQKYDVIKRLVDNSGNKTKAALQIGCTPRHINRLIQGYKVEGKAYFVHKNRGQQPKTLISNEIKKRIIKLYQTKYFDCNFKHFHELLREREHIHCSLTSVRTILRKSYIISPKAQRITKKKLKQELTILQHEGKKKKLIATIQSTLLPVELAHPRRSRSPYFGELIQMDASQHVWFGETKTFLHAAIDDATGMIVGAFFDSQETLQGYYQVLSQILTHYGIPYQFLTDNRTIFEYKKKQDNPIEKDTFTQFGYACSQLGIDIITSSIPQAKGRVERLFATLQSRLIVELRLNHITSVSEANEFLYSYIKKFNSLFALQHHHIKSVFETQPSLEHINLLLAVLSPRVIDSGASIRFNNSFFCPISSTGDKLFFPKGTKALIIKSFNGDLFVNIKDSIYALESIPDRLAFSKSFDPTPKDTTQKKTYIPPLSHPWKQASFQKFLAKQAHRSNL